MEFKRIAKKLGNSAYVNVPVEFLGKELIITDQVKQSITIEEIEDLVRRVIKEELEKVKG